MLGEYTADEQYSDAEYLERQILHLGIAPLGAWAAPGTRAHAH